MSEKKIVIDVLSHATSAPAQGVGSAFLEQTRLMEELGKEDFTLLYNKSPRKADIVHVHSVNPDFYFKMNKKTLSVCYVHFLPETLKGSIRLPKPIFSLFCRYVVSFYRRAKEIVVVNPSFLEPLTRLGIEKERITYIPNFVDERVFHPATPEEKEELREKLGIPKKSFVVIAVGQVQTRKGVLDFLKVADRNPDLFFLWLGGFSFKGITDGYPILKKEMEKKRKNVLFPGIVSREEMVRYYQLSDLFFLPSYNELFPMSLLEACSCGLPYLIRGLSLYQPILPKKSLVGKDNEEFSTLLKRLSEKGTLYQEALSVSKEVKETYSRPHVYRLWKEYYLRILDKYHKNK